MSVWTPAEIAAVVAVTVAFGQALAAGWRDLGVVTLAACGGALVLSRGEPTAFVAGAVLVALAIAAFGWNRGARRGVGRPGLDGLGFLLAAISALFPFILSDRVPSGPRERLVEAALVVLGLLASIGLALALERPGPRRRRPRFFRRVEVVEQPPEARGDARHAG